ncbi:cupin domain-containing protein [Engelhardtia mirabilis]|uniref:Cupin domain protein n=1 Tax=Engelhardtia mirabilis TaxID=2528011 RepID=A0A518BDC7_9BACT|nr:Cupin domain protein [Planctomycetes bacterium Pla133]QDU99301.1 Cupin domain protein [Planctomycetes bacterium Pla86]
MSDLKGNGPFRLSQHPAHLGLGATTVVQPEFTGEMDWYVAYGARHGADGKEGRLLAWHTFGEPWASWEVHPEGTEVVLVVAGVLTLHQELADGVATVRLGPGEYAINPPGVWHTADASAEDPATAIFITCGEGTDHRPR